jgi:hypothetical protein
MGEDAQRGSTIGVGDGVGSNDMVGAVVGVAVGEGTSVTVGEAAASTRGAGVQAHMTARRAEIDRRRTALTLGQRCIAHASRGRYLNVLRALAVALVLASCSMPGPVSHQCGVPVRDHVGFIDALRCDGFRAEPTTQATVPSLRVPGIVVLVNDLRSSRLSAPAELTSFWYDDTDLGGDARRVLDDDVRKFAPDGSLRDPSQRIYYQGTPHLFRRERVLVIYAGDDQGMLEVLRRLLGPQFAGG